MILLCFKSRHKLRIECKSADFAVQYFEFPLYGRRRKLGILAVCYLFCLMYSQVS
jgi:hypothetical protein